MTRRFLTPNGVPVFQSIIGPPVVLFDAQSLDPNYSYAVTLYCWYPQDPIGDLTDIIVGVQTAGNGGISTGAWNGFASGGTPIDAYRSNGNGPAKVMDRVVIRGDQQILAFPSAGYSAFGVTWWGYVERAGVAPKAMEYRPLQPDNNLAAPFNAPTPLGLSVLPGTTVTQTLHMLDGTEEQRMDFLSLYMSCVALGAPTGAPTCTLKCPGGVDVPITILEAVTDPPAGSPIHLFDDIPVRAPTPDDNLYQIEIVGDATVGLLFSGWGRFVRA